MDTQTGTPYQEVMVDDAAGVPRDITEAMTSLDTNHQLTLQDKTPINAEGVSRGPLRTDNSITIRGYNDFDPDGQFEALFEGNRKIARTVSLKLKNSETPADQKDFEGEFYIRQVRTSKSTTGEFTWSVDFEQASPPANDNWE